MSTMSSFNAMVRLRRERRGLSQTALAKALGVSQQAVSQWESGRSEPSAEQRAALVALLGIDDFDADASVRRHPPLPARASPPPLRSLPLGGLSPEAFEAFCTDLVNGLFDRAYRWGSQGHTQDGVDIVAETRDGRRLAFQCKRKARFGPADVRKAVSLVTSAADGYYLLLARKASPAARDAIATIPGWTLWDEDDLARYVRGKDINRDTAYRLVDTYFPGLREAFFGEPGPGPWLSTEQYFRPFMRTASDLSHHWDLVGRRDEIASVMDMVQHQRVALVTGIGGSGKTRFLKAVAERWEHDTAGKRVRFVAEHVPVEARHLEDLGSQPCLVIVDDAHERNDLPRLLQGLARMPPAIRLLLAARPYAKVSLQGDLARTGLIDPEKACGLTLELPALTSDEATSLAREALEFNGGSTALAERVGARTGDCPLATVLAGRMAASHRYSLLFSHEGGFRETLMRAFGSELLGRVGAPADERDLRDLAELIALVQPVEAEDPRFHELVEAVLHQAHHRTVRLVGVLERGGVLRRRGRMLRVMPDVLADLLIVEACVGEGTVATGFADHVFSVASWSHRANLVRNAGRIDWLLSAATRPSLLAGIWKAVERDFRAADGFRRQDLLTALSDVPWFQPEPALRLARVAVEEATRESDGDLLERAGYLWSVPRFLFGAAHHLECLPEALELLWLLGRNDERSFHGDPNHPIRVARELAAFRFGIPPDLAKCVIGVASGWFDDPNVEDYPHSPFDVLDEVLETEISDVRWHRHQAEVRMLPVPWNVVGPLRAEVIDLAFRELASGSPPRRLRALETLRKSLRTREGEALEIITRLKDTVAEQDLEPEVLEAIEERLGWLADRRDRTGVEGRALLAAFPDTLARNVTRAMRYEWPPVWLSRRRPHADLDTAERPYAEVEPEWVHFQDRVSAELCAQQSPGQVVQLLSRQMTTSGELSPRFFDMVFWRLPETARLIVERRLAGGDSAFDRVLDRAIAAWRKNDLSQARAWLRRAVDHGSYAVTAGAVRAMAHDGPDTVPPAPDEIGLVRELASHESDDVRVSVAELARRLAGAPLLAHDLLSLVRFADSNRVARSVALQFEPTGPLRVADMDRDQRQRIMENLEGLNSLEDHWVAGLLGSLLYVAPIEVVERLQRRVDRAGRDDAFRQPLPHEWAHGYSPFSIRESPHFEETLRSVRDWARRHVDDVHHGFWAPELWVAVAGDYDDQILAFLRPWLSSPDAKDVMTVSMLLAGARNSFVWDRADMVVALLTTAADHGGECLRRVTRDLWSCAHSGVRERVPGEPFSEDLRQRDEGKARAESLPLGSPARRFYRDLSRAAEAAIQATRLMDEEWEEA